MELNDVEKGQLKYEEINHTAKMVLEMCVVLQEKHHLDQKGIPVLNHYLLQIMSLFALEIHDQLHGCNEKMAQEVVTVARALITNHPARFINSEYQVISHLKKHSGFVTPTETSLGEVFVETTESGNEDIEVKEVTGMTVPFKLALTQIFNNSELRTLIERPVVKSLDNIIRSVQDGQIWKEHPVFQNHKNALIVQVYQDDVELVNPLGSKTGIHKITCVYWTLLNFPDHLRSDLRSISLLACIKSKDIKSFGFKPVLSEFFMCMEQMQSAEGLTLNLAGGESINVHGALISMNGDGLALNGIGGFKEGFGALRPCRNCMLTREEMNSNFVEKNLRNFETHQSQVKQILDENLTKAERTELSKNLGVVGKSVMSDLSLFDVTKQLPQDKMHNLLEGVFEIEAQQCILHFLFESNTKLTLPLLNNKLSTFPYPPELKKNKPSPILRNHLDANLRQKASQMMCLLAVLPTILQPFSNESNIDHLKNLALLGQIGHRLLAYEVKEKSIETLRFMIIVHHSRFAKLYPHRSLTPKFHFMVHAPSVIESFGPGRVTWCMRYESMNAWFSQTAGQTKNFLNIAKSLSVRFQMKKCLDLGLGNPHHQVLGGKTFAPLLTPKVQLASYRLGAQVADCFGIERDATVSGAEQLCINNFDLQPGTVLLCRYESFDLPLFAKVSALFVKETNAVLVLNLLETICFDNQRCAYEVRNTNKFHCMLADKLPTLQPFPLVSTQKSQFILPMYFDFDSFEG